MKTNSHKKDLGEIEERLLFALLRSDRMPNELTQIAYPIVKNMKQERINSIYSPKMTRQKTGHLWKLIKLKLVYDRKRKQSKKEAYILNRKEFYKLIYDKLFLTIEKDQLNKIKLEPVPIPRLSRNKHIKLNKLKKEINELSRVNSFEFETVKLRKEISKLNKEKRKLKKQNIISKLNKFRRNIELKTINQKLIKLNKELPNKLKEKQQFYNKIKLCKKLSKPNHKEILRNIKEDKHIKERMINTKKEELSKLKNELNSKLEIGDNIFKNYYCIGYKHFNKISFNLDEFSRWVIIFLGRMSDKEFDANFKSHYKGDGISKTRLQYEPLFKLQSLCYRYFKNFDLMMVVFFNKG